MRLVSAVLLPAFFVLASSAQPMERRLHDDDHVHPSRLRGSADEKVAAETKDVDPVAFAAADEERGFFGKGKGIEEAKETSLFKRVKSSSRKSKQKEADYAGASDDIKSFNAMRSQNHIAGPSTYHQEPAGYRQNAPSYDPYARFTRQRGYDHFDGYKQFDEQPTSPRANVHGSDDLISLQDKLSSPYLLGNHYRPHEYSSNW